MRLDEFLDIYTDTVVRKWWISIIEGGDVK
jgi:hypothetical protein